MPFAPTPIEEGELREGKILNYSHIIFSFFMMAGTPAAKHPIGISCVTTDPAAITEPSPMVAPLRMIDPMPIQTLLPILIGLVGFLPFNLWLSLSLIVTFGPMTTPLPISISSWQEIYKLLFVYPLPRTREAF